MGRRLPEDLVAAMYRDYLRLGSLDQAAKQHGRTNQSLWELFHKRGLAMPKKHGEEFRDHAGVRYRLDPHGYWRATSGTRAPLNRVVWEEANGPVPPGFEVCFNDGNKKNCAISNLELRSKGATAVQTRRSYWNHKHSNNSPYRPRWNRFDAGIERLWRDALPGEQFTAEQIAAACGVTRAAIADRERKILEKLRRRFGTRLEEFLS